MATFKPVIALIAMALALLVLAAACGGGGPKDYTFTIRVQQGQPVGGASTYQVKKDDTVTFSISSDTAGEAHLHGYDLSVDMEPGEAVTLQLTASATGRFPIEIEDTEVEIGYLEVQPR